ncbi:MAG: radical SAM protein [Candidatus Sedimenticola sp. (ex Thyasira tokunagai)]
MSERYARLGSDWLLRGWSDTPIAIVNRKTGEVRPLTKKAFYVTDSCDGNTNFDSFAFLPEHNALLDALINQGIAETCNKGDLRSAHQEYRKANNPQLSGIHWCITGRCNLNCRHCFMESPSGRYGELPLSDMLGLIDQFVEANVLNISLTGGEPFMRRDILDIVDALATNGIYLNQIYSNGLLITSEHLTAIKKAGYRPTFQISFDGVSAHDEMRGSTKSEHRVIEAIEMLKSADFPVVVATSLDATNAKQMLQTYKLMRDLGVSSWRVATPWRVGNWKTATTALPIDDEVRLYETLLQAWLKDNRPFNLQLSGLFTGFKGEAGKTYKPTYKPESHDCGSCRERPYLLPDGTLLPCPGYVESGIHEKMPSVFQRPLTKLWSDSVLREIADMKKEDLLSENADCADCDSFEECGLGCRAVALIETGILKAKDPNTCNAWKKGYSNHLLKIADRDRNLLSSNEENRAVPLLANP